MNDYTTPNGNFLSMLMCMAASKMTMQCPQDLFSSLLQNFTLNEYLNKMNTTGVTTPDELQSPDSLEHTRLSKTKRKKDKIYTCNYENCGKSFDYKWILERHMNSHFCFKLFKCEHDGCEKAYKSKENLNLHIKNKHLNIKPYQCQFCNLQFSHRNGKH
jgi:hypothetical protein